MKIITLLLALVLAINIQGQTSTVTKKILYTLQPNELIFGNEAITSLKKNSSNFCLITYDTITGKQTFVHNGKRIISINETDYFWIETLNLNENGFILNYGKDDQEYIIMNGVSAGPFEDILLTYCEKSNEYGYFYKLGSKYYFKLGNEKFGPFSNSHSGITFVESNKTFLSFNNWSNAVTANVSGQKVFEMISDSGVLSINSNGKTVETRKGVSRYSLFSSDRYGYISDSNDDFYHDMLQNIVINGRIVNNQFKVNLKYDDIFFVNQEDYYYSSTENNGLHSVYKNDNILYRNVKEIISYNRNGCFIYKDINGNFYLNGNKVLTNIVDYIYQPCIENENKYAFYYYQNDRIYVKSAEGVLGPYINVYDLKMSNGFLSFSYVDENHVRYSYKNGKISLNDVNLNFFDIQENASFLYENLSFESSYEYNFVVINGDSYGKSPALQSWIDPVDKKIFWTALEKNEYVLYTYVFN